MVLSSERNHRAVRSVTSRGCYYLKQRAQKTFAQRSYFVSVSLLNLPWERNYHNHLGSMLHRSSKHIILLNISQH